MALTVTKVHDGATEFEGVYDILCDNAYTANGYVLTAAMFNRKAIHSLIPVLGFGETSADLVEALAYGGFRPGEILAARVSDFAPDDLGQKYLRISQRNVDGAIVPGTKSSRYPEKDVFLLGPLSKTLARRAEAASDGDFLFPYPGTVRLWTESDYRNWREDYFVPIARGHGLGSESDDPYALRHIYATLRIAAHHPTLYIEGSMGTGLVGRVYGGVIRRYEGKGPLNIDAEIAAARKAALANRPRLRLGALRGRPSV